MTENNTNPRIYSKATIVGFCMFLSPFFGAFLLRQNLIDIGKRREATWFLLLGFIMSMFNTAFVQVTQGGAGLVGLLNLVQGAILCETAFRKYIPDESAFDKKPITRPLLFALMLTFLLLLLMLSGGMPVQPK